MILLAFYHEITHGLADDVATWDSLASAMGFDGVVFVDQLGDFSSRRDPRAYQSLADLIDAHPTYQLIYMTLPSQVPQGWTSEELDAVNHPVGDVIYMVGSNYTGIPPAEMSRQNGSIACYISGPGGSSPSLWAHTVGALVAYSRHLFWG